MKMRLYVIFLLSCFISNAQEFAFGQHILTNCQGTVWSTGSNVLGELELGNNNSAFTFTQIPTITNAKKISVSTLSSLVLLSNGEVLSFGYNNSGQLGINSTASMNSPTNVLGVNGNGILNNIIDIDAIG